MRGSIISSFKALNYNSLILLPRPCLFNRHRFLFNNNNYYYYLYPFVRPPFASASFSSSSHCSGSESGSFMEVVKAACRRGSSAADRIAIRADQNSYTYTQLVSSAFNISRLLSSSNVKTNDGVSSGHGNLGGARIGIVAKPSAEFVAGMLGTWFSGGVAVPLALSYPEAELLHVMNDSDISFVLSTEEYRETMQSVAARSAAQFSLIPPVPSISSSPNFTDQIQIGEIEAEGSLIGENPALVVYTSGTTGKPKGVVHTHKSITAQVQMLTEAWEYTSSDQFLHCLPLHHVHGLFNALLAPLYAGSTVEFMPKFSVRGIWQRWRESYTINGSKADDSITVFTGVPTMYTRLIQGYHAMDPEQQAVSASAARQLRLMMCGSSALPQPVMQEWETITGHLLLERYGMTEFVMAISNPLRGARKAGTVGKPFPGVQVRIAEDKSGDDMMGVGELCVKSPSLFKEYWKLPQVTKESFTDDGFFKTGDAGRVDEDGYYIILGRTSADIMKVGGYKLSALEIESVLLEHPDIAECCVLGLPDKDYGEAVSAIVVLESETKGKQEDSNSALSLEELCTWAKDKLAPYKLPTRLMLWDSLPRNAMGKVNKKELKRQLGGEK
ncbi:PREDICTED: malonate--CoA ligase isoform X1 [Theobroma cacao]|uniref:Malonate--CoA ligase isoform X1 n=1 Tax=Theobroma cacao TaxID=3641 RepID=A0AB32WN35_THECC|nr:PREDICTED: malonate--CoA ligase isoform X1 [Theobroma cacao]